MRASLDEALCRDFPLLYADRHASMRNTCMCWGFDVGDGWEPIIRRLSEKLEATIAKMPEDAQDFCKADQVKEKFGTLRFYMSAESDEMSKWIREAEQESAVTCETCGAPGTLTRKGWHKTACKEHTP